MKIKVPKSFLTDLRKYIPKELRYESKFLREDNVIIAPYSEENNGPIVFVEANDD